MQIETYIIRFEVHKKKLKKILVEETVYAYNIVNVHNSTINFSAKRKTVSFKV